MNAERRAGGSPDEQDESSLDRVLPRVLSSMQAHGHIGVIVLDLEPLAHVETDCGGAAYDALLAGVRGELDALRNQIIRATDVVCALRPNGEQVVVFLEGARGPQELSEEAIERVAERLWLALTPRIAELGRPYGNHARLRLGYAVCLRNPMIKPERLIYRAVDQARAMSMDHTRRVDLRARELLRDLIVHRRLSTVFQPIYDMSSAHGQVQAFEALIRGPDGELATPAMLFDLAQHVDLATELDRACCDCNLTRAAALPESTLLFANVLPTLINDPDFRCWLIEKVRAHYRGRLVLELSEGVAIKNHEILARGLEELRSGGVRIALDDLGAGYANLDHVVRLEPDFLKLDIALVREVDRNPVKRAMISSMVSVAEAVGATLIAEGIETESERDALVQLGVAWGQGFFFARPSAHYAEAVSS